MSTRVLSALVALVTVLGALAMRSAGANTADDFAVVVNSGNSIEFDSIDAARNEVKRLYLKQASAWSNRVDAAPYGRADDTPEQAAFLEQVLGMSTAELARHWISEKNRNGTVPPKDVTSDRMLAKFIEKYDGAFGVVTPAEAEEHGLRVLFTF